MSPASIAKQRGLGRGEGERNASQERPRRTVRDYLRGIPPELVGLIGVLVAFQVFPAIGVLPADHFPTTTDIAKALWGEIGSPEYWAMIGDTMRGWAAGLALATVVGVLAGVLIGSSWPLRAATRPLIEFLRPIPSVALIPLAVLTLGTGPSMKLFLVTYSSLWPILYNTIYGIRGVDPVLVETGRVFGLKRLNRVFRITLPEAAPYIATGLRVSAATALLLAVTAELVVGSSGIGLRIKLAEQAGAVPLMYGLIVTAGMLGVVINMVLRAVELRFLHWHPSYRKSHK